MTAHSLLPLTPLSTAVLTALAAEELHGYGLMQAVSAQSGGILSPGTGTLYAALNRLLQDGLIADTDEVADDRRRGRTYAISRSGRDVLAAEMRRLEEVLTRARRANPALAADGGR
jgi:DNA-binding PadR family transcriptional regulator